MESGVWSGNTKLTTEKRSKQMQQFMLWYKTNYTVVNTSENCKTESTLEKIGSCNTN